MIALRTVLLVCYGWLAAGMAAAAAPEIPEILVVGDSLSAGYGIDVTRGWVNLLQRQLKHAGYPHRIINASISGDTTGGGLRRLPELLKTHTPAAVVLELGANDGLRGVPLSEIEHNFTQLIERIRGSHARTVVLRMRLPPNYGPDYIRGFDAIYDRLAGLGEDVSVAPFFLANVVLEPGLLQADGLHPTADAQPRMLEAVWPTVVITLRKP